MPGGENIAGLGNKAAAVSERGPFVGGFRIQGKRLKSAQDVSKRFAELSFLEMSTEEDTLAVLNVESRDLRKEPALFSIIYFGPVYVRAIYTCLSNMSPKKRRIEVLRQFLNLLTLAEDCYSVDTVQLHQLLESSIADMSQYVTMDYDKLFALYDNLKTETTLLQKKVRELSEANATLSKENYELKSKNDELVLKIKSLETLSDTVLSLKLQEWITEHRGEINISDFSKVFGVTEARVEQMLNKLVTEGYLGTKG